MIAGALNWVSIPVALFIGSIGAVSVFKAVYIDKRALKCACVGGDSNVPLGFISLTENLMMVAMAIWMLSTDTRGYHADAPRSAPLRHPRRERGAARAHCLARCTCGGDQAL